MLCFPTISGSHCRGHCHGRTVGSCRIGCCISSVQRLRIRVGRRCHRLFSLSFSGGFLPMLLRTTLWTLLCLTLSCGIAAAGQPAAETRQFIAADSSRQRAALIGEDGQTIWEQKIGPLHDLHVLPGGNILMQLNWTEVVEIVPRSGEIVWRYDAAKQPANKGVRIEIHAFERLPDGSTMIAESGPARLIELTHDLQVRHTIALKVPKPDPHHDTRLVRRIASGNYLVCHETEGLVREYRPDGTTEWEYQVPLFGRERRPGHGVDAFGNQVFSAYRLPNGNTLIGTGNGHSILEVTKAGQVVWSLHQNDLPGIQLAWVTSLQVLPGGNL
ncbi:MAG TPA: hypothetical protein DIT89_16380, partial [Planctomycetaceae bacterium]|nr:hypothetical protein [Planctomycetaceae bacterium]